MSPEGTEIKILRGRGVVSVVFRHVRLFPRGKFFESDVRGGKLVGLRESLPTNGEDG